MNTQEVLERYIQLCVKNLGENQRVCTLLRKQGITESFLFENFRLGYANSSMCELIKGNGELNSRCDQLGLLIKGKEVMSGHLTIPILDEQKGVVNIAGYNVYPQSKKKFKCLTPKGIFNQAFLRNIDELILTNNPLVSCHASYVG